LKHSKIFFLIAATFANAQLYIPADPIDLLFTEEKIMVGGQDPGSLMIRPVIPIANKAAGSWLFKIKNELFYNTDSPNLENTSDRWIGKGSSYFTSANIVYNSKYFFGSIEPYYFISQNDDYAEPQRMALFNNLNDNRPHQESPYSSVGLREMQFYANIKGFGGGYSNANMWWGPGLHNSLMVSNNTTGFRHLMLGTINERRLNNWGFNGRYVFSKLGQGSKNKPYLSGFIVNATYYSHPTVTLGFSRILLSGGANTSYKISRSEAALLPFQILSIDNKSGSKIYNRPIEQMYTGYLNFRFPKSGVVLFFEWGRNEGPIDFDDFVLAPDHSNAFITGLRKYGLFNNINLFLAIEYTNIAHGSLWKTRETNDWYSNPQFEYNTYNGRHWAAHSGPDSDDFLLLIGYANDGFAVIPSFHYERHGLTHSFIPTYEEANTLVDDFVLGDQYLSEERTIYRGDGKIAEAKFEFRCDIRYRYREYRFSLIYEHEHVFNYRFADSDDAESNRSGNVLWFSVEKNFTKILDNWFRK